MRKEEVSNISFAKNLKQSRKKEGLTQEKLAELVGVTRQAISTWEQGSKYPEVDNLIWMAKKLKISLDWLFAEELARSDEPQVRILPGIVTGLEAFASSIDDLMGQKTSKTDNKN